MLEAHGVAIWVDVGRVEATVIKRLQSKRVQSERVEMNPSPLCIHWHAYRACDVSLSAYNIHYNLVYVFCARSKQVFCPVG
jgi:hypothetical protein